MKNLEYMYVHRMLVTKAVSMIIAEEAPEEVDILDVIADEFYNRTDKRFSTSEHHDKMMSFSGAELNAYLSLALIVAYNMGILFIIEFVKKTIEKSAEKSIDSLAKQIGNILSKLKRKEKPAESINILIPINWTEFEKRIREDTHEVGIPASSAKRAAKLVVRELSENQILLGDMVLEVTKKLPSTKLKK